MDEPVATKTLSGWGNHPRVECAVVRPGTRAALRGSVTRASAESPRIARGLGRSYADQALNDRGRVIDCTRLDRYLDFDPATGRLTCEAGVTLEMILRDFAPRGFLPAITPGTKFVTIGGCIANDIHGKAHHADGCFSNCVESFRVLLANGETVNASPTEHADLYWASFGGMGLLGIITEATFRLRKVETTYFRQRAIPVANLEALLDAFEETADQPYSVAWVDSLATGEHLGKGVLTVGDHATLADLPPKKQADPLAVSDPSPLVVPFELPEAALNTVTIRLLNAVLDQVQRRGAAIAHYEKFFYPLDFVGEWNKGYGKRGFTQYQFVIPLKDGLANLRLLLERIATGGQWPFLNVLKRLGPERPETLLSFPFEGYTFAIDFPIRPGLDALLAELDALVIGMGGRVYLGKDAFLKAEQLAQMYPRLAEWKAIKARYDPEGRFSSNLARRLGLG